MSLPEFDYLRPTFGGGSRPTHDRGIADVCGLYDIPGPGWDLFNPFSRWDSGLTHLRSAPDKTQLATGTKPSVERLAPWMKTAKAEIGVAEVKGKHNSNPRILEYFKASKFWGKDDSGAKNAWCGSFVAWVMQQNNITPVKNAFRAKEWKKFGSRLKNPVYGAIGIKSRKGGGHVAFIVGQSKNGNSYFMLGGNQKDKVQILEYSKDVWEAFVFPKDYDASQSQLPVYRGTSTEKAGQES
jgi:uncharacterized protein (TIGR02594 family)